jgi:FAD/FMN-containing dehydrogenase
MSIHQVGGSPAVAGKQDHGAEEVAVAVRCARANGPPIAVRGGGHDWAGRALADSGLVIDMSRMRRVDVDGAARIAMVSGGATAADAVDASELRGLVPATGNFGLVGMAGLTLGGGYGPLNGVAGLALDNLLGADVVLHDGRIVAADAEHESDLFWALRGGGGNFGVVTAMRMRLHPIPSVVAGVIMYPWHPFNAGAIDALVVAGDTRASAYSGVAIHHCHGAATRVPIDATAFGIRERHFVVEVLAAWEPEHDATPHRGWAQQVYTDLAPHAIDGGYPNLIGPQQAEQARKAYGPNASRLAQLKSRYDPDNVFTATARAALTTAAQPRSDHGHGPASRRTARPRSWPWPTRHRGADGWVRSPQRPARPWPFAPNRRSQACSAAC